MNKVSKAFAVATTESGRTNQQRIDKAQSCLDKYDEPKDNSAVTDLLTDLYLLCIKNNWNIEDHLGIARGHALYELEEEREVFTYNQTLEQLKKEYERRLHIDLDTHEDEDDIRDVVENINAGKLTIDVFINETIDRYKLTDYGNQDAN